MKNEKIHDCSIFLNEDHKLKSKIKYYFRQRAGFNVTVTKVFFFLNKSERNLNFSGRHCSSLLKSLTRPPQFRFISITLA